MTPTTTVAAAAPPPTSMTGAQYLTFICSEEEYGVEILRVQEIKGWEQVTRVPYAPDYVLGVINLRGMIVPVIDLRTRLALGKREFDSSTVVIVVRVQSGRGEKIIGVVVDGVSDVYHVSPEAIRAVPELGAQTQQSCIKGIATVDGKMVMMLDVDMLVSACLESDGARQGNA